MNHIQPLPFVNITHIPNLTNTESNYHKGCIEDVYRPFVFEKITILYKIISNNIKILSQVTSNITGYLPPIAYSMTRKRLRMVIKTLTPYKVNTSRSQGSPVAKDLLVGRARRRVWKMRATKRKIAKIIIWKTSPARIMVSPLFFLSRLSAPESIPAPKACTKKQKTSPPTKIFVTQLTRRMEKFSAPVARIKRLRIIYTVAAKRIGARRIKSAWIMYGIRAVVL
jgi:hypothetical protein